MRSSNSKLRQKAQSKLNDVESDIDELQNQSTSRTYRLNASLHSDGSLFSRPAQSARSMKPVTEYQRLEALEFIRTVTILKKANPNSSKEHLSDYERSILNELEWQSEDIKSPKKSRGQFSSDSDLESPSTNRSI